jgi:hypothetical protein
MKFKQIELLEGRHGGVSGRGIGVLEDGSVVWVTVNESDQLPTGLLRNLEVTALKVVDKRQPLNPSKNW